MKSGQKRNINLWVAFHTKGGGNLNTYTYKYTLYQLCYQSMRIDFNDLTRVFCSEQEWPVQNTDAISFNVSVLAHVVWFYWTRGPSTCCLGSRYTTLVNNQSHSNSDPKRTSDVKQRFQIYLYNPIILWSFDQIVGMPDQSHLFWLWICVMFDREQWQRAHCSVWTC